MDRRYIETTETKSIYDAQEKYVLQWEMFEDFYNKYQGRCLQFDGIANVKEWRKTNHRILFLLKDSYRPFKDGKITNTDAISTYVFDEIFSGKKVLNKKEDRTWFNSMEWAKTISDFLGWGKDYQIAFMNVSKLAFSAQDGTETQNSDLNCAVKDDEKLLKEQFLAISPTIVICGCTGKYLFKFLGVDVPKPTLSAKKGKRNPLNLYVLENDNNKYFVFDAYHPSYRSTTTVKEFEKLITENEELFNNYENRKN